MTCSTVKIGETVAIVCSRGRKTRLKCSCCGAPAGLLCDFPTGATGATCSKPLCSRCAVHVGHQLDYCPDHELPAQGVLL